MDELIIIVIIKEIWDKVNIVAFFVMIGGIILAGFQWKSDRFRLAKLEKDRDNMRYDFAEYKDKMNEILTEIRADIHNSNESVLREIGELKGLVTHRNINQRGENRK